MIIFGLGRQSPALNDEKRQDDFVEVLLARGENLKLRRIIKSVHAHDQAHMGREGGYSLYRKTPWNLGTALNRRLTLSKKL